jgi:hypothetical protein
MAYAGLPPEYVMTLSADDCDRLLTEIKRRAEDKSCCTFKMVRFFASRGIRTDLSRGEGNTVMDEMRKSKGVLTPRMVAKWCIRPKGENNEKLQLFVDILKVEVKSKGGVPKVDHTNKLLKITELTSKDINHLSSGDVQMLLTAYTQRSQQGMCTFRQSCLLKSKGLEYDVTFKQAVDLLQPKHNS